jgi:3-deoxy-7-phosphoheptulonate synthase
MPSLMIDCSHANSAKQPARQIDVAADIASQIAGGSRHVMGVMVESHLVAGRQAFTPGSDDPAKLAYGQSITDGCLGWDDSVKVLETLDRAVTTRRRADASRARHRG